MRHEQRRESAGGAPRDPRHDVPHVPRLWVSRADRGGLLDLRREPELDELRLDVRTHARVVGAPDGMRTLRQDVAWGALAAAAVAAVGLGVYLAAIALNVNRFVVPVPPLGHWWTIPILLLSAGQAGATAPAPLEEPVHEETHLVFLMSPGPGGGGGGGGLRQPKHAPKILRTSDQPRPQISVPPVKEAEPVVVAKQDPPEPEPAKEILAPVQTVAFPSVEARYVKIRVLSVQGPIWALSRVEIIDLHVRNRRDICVA